MSLAELLPLVEGLEQSDQRQLMTFLVSKFPAITQDNVFSAETYPVWSPYDSFEAADILMQMVNDDEPRSVVDHRNASTNV
jgi:hypothetical protein